MNIISYVVYHGIHWKDIHLYLDMSWCWLYFHKYNNTGITSMCFPCQLTTELHQTYEYRAYYEILYWFTIDFHYPKIAVSTLYFYLDFFFNVKSFILVVVLPYILNSVVLSIFVTNIPLTTFRMNHTYFIENFAVVLLSYSTFMPFEIYILYCTWIITVNKYTNTETVIVYTNVIWIFKRGNVMLCCLNRCMFKEMRCTS